MKQETEEKHRKNTSRELFEAIIEHARDMCGNDPREMAGYLAQLAADAILRPGKIDPEKFRKGEK